MKTEEINTSFNDIINKSSIDFARTSSDMIKSVFDQSLRVEQTEVLKEAFNSELNFYVSIFFTGMVYGEYILAMNDETAA
jgi:predicted acetyltransferase